MRAPSHTYLPLTMVDIRLSSNTVIDQALPASYNGSPYPVEGELLTPGITRPPERLKMKAPLMRVGCMPFLCKVNTQAAALSARSLRLYKRSSKYQ